VALPELTPQLALPEEAVTVLFCRVDDVYYRINPQGRRYETLKELSDSEVVTLALIQQLRGVESERSFLREAAHIRPLGAPHNGPDTLDNTLCLCPNHHVLFDHSGITIDEDLSLVGVEGRLAVHPRHSIDDSHLRYCREHYQANT
jgi:hypothetical protein